MIPKIIHYCWFGSSPLPYEFLTYIDGWKKIFPEFEIKCWDETTFDIFASLPFVQEAYQVKKYAFVADYVRMWAMYQYGGIYMDTDVEVCKPLDHLASYAFWSGFESKSQIPTGIMASCRDNELLEYLLSYYDDKYFRNENGSFDTTTNVTTITKMVKDKYDIELNNTFQIFGNNNAIFPFEYFCAKDLFDGKIKKTHNTYTIHHFSGSWLNEWGKIKQSAKIYLSKFLGRSFVEMIAKIKNIIK